MFKNLSLGAIGIRATMQEGLELAKQTGWQGMDLNLGEARQLAEQLGSVEAVKKMWQDAGIKMGGWGLPVNWRGTDEQFYDGLSKLPSWSQLAAELGCHRTMTVVPGWSDDRPRKENWDFTVKRLRLCAEILKDYGHRLGLEFIGPRTSRAPHKYAFTYTMDGVLALCCAIGTGNVGLLFDVWHWYCCQSTLDDVKKLTADDVVYVHINDAPAGINVLDQIDNQRCLPGETGVIPNEELLRILKDIGYDGPVTPEPFSQKVNQLAAQSPQEAARLTREALDKVWKAAGLP